MRVGAARVRGRCASGERGVTGAAREGVVFLVEEAGLREAAGAGGTDPANLHHHRVKLPPVHAEWNCVTAAAEQGEAA